MNTMTDGYASHAEGSHISPSFLLRMRSDRAADRRLQGVAASFAGRPPGHRHTMGNEARGREQPSAAHVGDQSRKRTADLQHRKFSGARVN